MDTTQFGPMFIVTAYNTGEYCDISAKSYMLLLYLDIMGCL